MKELSIKTDNDEHCVGCEFVRQFAPHDGGYCQVHGDIEGTTKRDIGADTIIDKLGGNDLSLMED